MLVARGERLQGSLTSQPQLDNSNIDPTTISQGLDEHHLPSQPMRKALLGVVLILCTAGLGLRILHGFSEKNGRLVLPSSKLLGEVPGNPQPTNSFPTAMALSPDGKYLALLNDGYGTFESDYKQSIAVLNLATNKLADFPDPRLERKARQTYFYGLALSGDGNQLSATMSSIT